MKQALNVAAICKLAYLSVRSFEGGDLGAGNVHVARQGRDAPRRTVSRPMQASRDLRDILVPRRADDLGKLGETPEVARMANVLLRCVRQVQASPQDKES
ncbi:MAG: hypothetical protein ACYC1W_11700, partial [Gemmatimonadaceae bacterium]